MPRAKTGFVLFYAIILFTLMIAFASLGVDFGRVQSAKAEARRTADAAARAGVQGLATSVATAQSAAVSIAASNKVDGTNVTIDPATDVEFGTWSSGVFTVLTGTARSNATAIRVTVARTTARGNPVPLWFTRLFGRNSCDLTVSAIVLDGASNKLQLVGTSGVTVWNNFFGGVYRSSVTTSPSHGNYQTGATAMSNSAISAGMNEALKGVILGPSGTSNLNTTDAPVVLSSALTFALPTGATSTQDFTINGTVNVAGGTYYANDLTIGNGGTLQFTGPATIYFSGTVKFSGDASILAYNNIPANLKIYHTGTGSFGSNSANNTTITADMYCPGVDFFVKNNAILTGRFIFKTITAKNNLDFYYDDTLVPLYASPHGPGIVVK